MDYFLLTGLVKDGHPQEFFFYDHKASKLLFGL